MGKTILLFGVITAVACVIVGIVRADETETLISEVIKDARTDSERSSKLLDAVSLIGEDKKSKLALLEAALKYGMKSLRTAEDCNRTLGALDMLTKIAPQRASEWRSQPTRIYSRLLSLTKPADRQKLARKIVSTLVRKGHGAATKGAWGESLAAYTEAKKIASSHTLPVRSNISVRLRILGSLSRARGNVDRYTAVLKNTPDNAQTRTNLVRNLLTTLDDPTAAVGHVNDSLDQKFQAYVPLAAKKISDVPAEGCKSLAQWYHKELSRSALPIVKYRMLKRAKIYYQRVIEVHSTEDPAGAALPKLAISSIDAELSKLKYADPLSCVYCLGGEQTACGDCMVAGASTGTVLCTPCQGLGRLKCEACGGYWGVKCKSCGGKGGVYTRKYSKKKGLYKEFNRCRPCKGKGVMHRARKRKTDWSMSVGVCPECGTEVMKYRGSTICKACRGKGRSGQCDSCNGAKLVACTQCKSGN
ncbi:MAG: hypothetical protein QGG42_00820 [Phycisphaerae bacterium]|nr:hypothetical protein [Phycisphaerae bacterium]